MADNEIPLDKPPVVRYYGPFHLRKLIDAIRGFLLGEGFDDIQEPSYKHKVGGEGTDLEIKLKTDRKLNAYVKYEMEIEMRISDMKDVEVARDGEKLKMQHGRVQITVNGKTYLDFQKHFEGNNFLKSLRTFYHKMILGAKVYEYADYIETRAMRLQDLIKRTLGTETHG